MQAQKNFLRRRVKNLFLILFFALLPILDFAPPGKAQDGPTNEVNEAKEANRNDVRTEQYLGEFKSVPGQIRMFKRIKAYQQSLQATALNARSAYWSRLDFSSTNAYLNSLIPYRADFYETIGIPVDLQRPQAVSLASSRLVKTIENVDVYRWILSIGNTGLQTEALVGIPRGRARPLPVVVGFYGSSGTPERVFGLDRVFGLNADRDYHEHFALQLAKAGYMVYIPYLVIDFSSMVELDTDGINLGMRMMGIETGLAMRALDYFATRSDINAKAISVYGISYGGVLASYLGASDTRIKVTINSGAFSDEDTVNRLKLPSSIYFKTNNRTMKFTHDTMPYLIAPRSFFVERGELDGFELYNVRKVFDRVKTIYERLGIPDRVGIVRGQGGHEPYLEVSLKFLAQEAPPAPLRSSLPSSRRPLNP